MIVNIVAGEITDFIPALVKNIVAGNPADFRSLANYVIADNFKHRFVYVWLRDLESNQDYLIQSQGAYH